MRFGVLGTGFWAKEVHAAALAAHPDGRARRASGAATSRRPRRSARSSTSPGYGDVDELLAQVDAVAIALPPDVQAPLAERAAAAGKHLLLEKPIALDVAGADRVVDAVRGGRRRLGRVLHLPVPAGDVDLAGAGRAHEAGRRARRPGCRSLGRIAVRRLALAQGARRALGHRPARAVAAGAGARARSSRCRPAPGSATPSTWSSTTSPAVASTVTLSHTVAPMSAGHRVLRARRRRPAGAAARGRAPRSRPFAVAVDELTAAALTGGAHPCDVGFGRDVVAVLAAATRALDSRLPRDRAG